MLPTPILRWSFFGSPPYMPGGGGTLKDVSDALDSRKVLLMTYSTVAVVGAWRWWNALVLWCGCHAVAVVYRSLGLLTVSCETLVHLRSAAKHTALQR